MSNMSFSDAIAARVGPGYGLGKEVAAPLISRVLAIYAAEYAGTKPEKKKR